MELSVAVKRLSALAQESRLAVFRLLVTAGLDGLPAGEIARTLAIPPNTLSTQLNILANAGLVSSRRLGRSIVYAVDFTGMSDLLIYLMEDCCQGRPEMCGPMVEIAAREACRERPERCRS